VDEKLASEHPVELKQLTTSTYLRLLAMRAQESEAAKVMLTRDAYPDFFVERPGGSFHEFFGDPALEAHASTLVRASRMAFLNSHVVAGDYSDFFVDSPRNGPPFHEAFGDSGPRPELLITDVSARVKALSASKVIAAFLKLKGE
jgi:hypothetical protein